jgi:hypothetical protein
MRDEKEQDLPRYRATLERLPKGSTATPRVVFISPHAKDLIRTVA